MHATAPAAEHELALLVRDRGRQADHAHLGRDSQELAGRLGAVEARHSVVDHDHVRPELATRRDGLGTTVDRTDHLDPLAEPEEELERLAEETVVLDEHHAYAGHRRSLEGHSAASSRA